MLGVFNYTYVRLSELRQRRGRTEQLVVSVLQLREVESYPNPNDDEKGHSLAHSPRISLTSALDPILKDELESTLALQLKLFSIIAML